MRGACLIIPLAVMGVLVGRPFALAATPEATLPYQDDRFPAIRFAYPPSLVFNAVGQWKHSREPVMRRMPNGSLLCFHCTGGPSEPHNDNVGAVTRSTDDGLTWSKPETPFDHPERATYVSEFFVEDGSPRAFVHTFDHASHYTEMRAFQSTTTDSGKSWSEPTALPGNVNGCLTRRGIVLADGAWLFPVYTHEQTAHWAWKDDGQYFDFPRWPGRCSVLRSTNRGESYSMHGYLKAKCNRIGNGGADGGKVTPDGELVECSLIEPAVVELEPNHIVMLIRAEYMGKLYRSDSRDGGLTWTDPQPTDIPSAGAKMTLFKLGDAVAMVFNPASSPGWKHRTSLELWVSRDGCKTWPVKRTLAKAEPGTVVCYPDGFADMKQKALYLVCDTSRQHFFFRVPFADFLE